MGMARGRCACITPAIHAGPKVAALQMAGELVCTELRYLSLYAVHHIRRLFHWAGQCCEGARGKKKSASVILHLYGI